MEIQKNTPGSIGAYIVSICLKDSDKRDAMNPTRKFNNYIVGNLKFAIFFL